MASVETKAHAEELKIATCKLTSDGTMFIFDIPAWDGTFDCLVCVGDELEGIYRDWLLPILREHEHWLVRPDS